MLRAFVIFIFCFSLLLCQGCDVKGANDPFSYVPRQPDVMWKPPPKGQKRLAIEEDLKREGRDYHEFSKEAPLTLGEIIDISLSRNPKTKASWAAARVSAAEYGQSLQNYFILAEGLGNYTRTRFGEVIGKIRNIFYQTTYNADLQLTYTILDFGQTRMTSEAALQSLFSSDWSHNNQLQLVIQTVMNDYYDYLYQRQLLFSAEQDVINAQVILDSTEEKFRQGLADISDIVQARTNYLSQKLTLVNQKQTLHTTYTQLINDMGLPSDEMFYFQDYPEEIIPFELETLDNLIVRANQNRPDLMAAEARVKSSVASYQAAYLKKTPVVTGQFDIGRQYFQHGLNDRYDFTAQVNLTFPIFQGFFIENSIKKAKATIEESKAGLEQVRLNIIQEVANYRSNVSYAKESIDYAQSYLESAEEDFKVNLKKYRVGTGTIVDVINAQTAVADARSRLATAQNSWYTSIANLAYATGILFYDHDKQKTPYLQLIEEEEKIHEKPSI